MSVAERLSHDDAMSTAAASPSSAIDNILRLALRNVTAARPPAAEVRRADPDFTMAAGLLDRATATIATLTAQRDDLHQTLVRQEAAHVRLQEEFTEKLNQIQAAAAEWERRAKIMKEQLKESETRLADQQARVETLTLRAENAEAALALAERSAKEAQQQAQMYHDRIIDTFGSLFDAAASAPPAP